MAMTFSELFAATLSGSWSRKIRPTQPSTRFYDGLHMPIPQQLHAELKWLEKVTGGEAVFYGGCFAAWAENRQPRDIDIALLTNQHPLLAWARILVAAALVQKPFGKYLWRHALPWKRVRLKTPAGLLDIGCVQVNHCQKARDDIIRRYADSADFGIVAASGTLRQQIYTDRFINDMHSGQLTCRPLFTRRDYRNGAYKRIPKYMLRYPDRPMVFVSPADARFFRPLVAMREKWLKDRPTAEEIKTTVSTLYQEAYGFKPPRS